MDTTSTSNVENTERQTHNEGNRNEENIPSMEKLEAMVTPEQVHSASVAKKRRTITRKRTNELNKARSQTPMRGQLDAGETSTDDDIDYNAEQRENRKKRPRTPDRNRNSLPRKIEPNVSSNRIRKTNEKDNVNVENNESIKDVVPNPKSENTEKQDTVESLKKVQLQKLAETSPEETEKTEMDSVTGETLKKKLPQKLADVPAEDVDDVVPDVDVALSMKVIGDDVEVRPETPPEVVYRRHRSKKPDSGSASNSERQSVISDRGPHERASSLPRQLEEQIHKIDNFVTTNTQELMNLFQRAKSSVEEKGKELRRRKFKKTGEEQKRSQSQPKQLTETDVLESFKRAQKATAEREETRIRSKSARRYSSGSEKSHSPERSAEPQRPSRKRVLVQDIIKQKKSEEKKAHAKLRDKVKCNKIVEVLDPKTSKVIETRNIGEVAAKMRYFDVFKIFKYYSLKQIFKEYRKYKNDMRDEYNIIRRLRWKCINHLLILIIFCGLGGIMFKTVEGTFENFYKCGVKRVKRDFVDLLWTKSHNMREEEWKSLARNRLRVFEEELHNAHEAGVHSYSGQRSWSFLNGIVYCLTVVTTIGYGHLYPTTKTGQALTIVYSLIGIPLFLIILTDFGKLFTRCIKFVWSFVRRLYYTGSCRSMRKTTHAQEIFKGAQMMYEIATFRRPSAYQAYDPNMMHPAQGSSPHESTEGTTTAPPTPAISNFEIDDEFNLPISVAILLLVLYILLGAVLFGIWEGWDFFASFYFVFISMSTIGFGDYVPRHPIFMIVSIVYLVFGLALMSMCINVVQVKLSDTFSQASAKLGATMGLGVANEDGTIKPVPPKHVEMPQVHGSIIELDKLSPNTSYRS